MTYSNRAEYGEPWTYKKLFPDGNYYDVTDANAITSGLVKFNTQVSPSNENAERIVDCVNACASLNVANGELDAVLEICNEICKAHAQDTTIIRDQKIRLQKALDALRAKAPALAVE